MDKRGYLAVYNGDAPFLDRNGWDASVNTRMIKLYGAPINADDTKTIVEYLNANYGKS